MHQISPSLSHLSNLRIIPPPPPDTLTPLTTESMPDTLFVWDALKQELNTVIKHMSKVKYSEWNPTSSVLAVCTGNQNLYLWRETGVSVANLGLEGVFYMCFVKVISV